LAIGTHGDRASKELQLKKKIEALTGEQTEYNIYAAMVADPDQGQAFVKRLGQLDNIW
jgi:hypothetical protein